MGETGTWRNAGGAPCPKQKWGPALLPGPTAPSVGFAGVRDLGRSGPKAPSTRPRSWRTSSGVASHRGGPKTRFLVRFSSRESLSPQFPSASARRLPRPRCSTALLGLGPFHAASSPWGGNCPRTRKHQLFRRLLPTVRNSVRCVIAPKDSSASNLVPSPAGGDRYFRHSPLRLAVASFLVRRGLPSRSQLEPALRIRVAPSGIFGLKPVDNGDIGCN
jgi:hypothetical protein